MGERKDKKHRFPIRIDSGLFSQIQADAFRHQVSVNLLMCEMIRFAAKSQTFKSFLDRQYPIKSGGHFVYIRDDQTERRR